MTTSSTPGGAQTYNPSTGTWGAFTPSAPQPFSAGPGTPNAPANLPGTPGYNPTGGVPLSTPAPTISSLYGSESEADKNLDTTTGVYGTAANTPVDEQAIRDATTARLQAEIDATNKIYDQKLAQAKIAGEGNLGSNAAISARRGLLGSDFGNSLNQDVLTKNDAVYSGIGDERAAALAGITNAGITEANNEIAQKTAAKQQSATDYINFLSQQESRRTARTGNAASQALAAGIDLTDPNSADVKSIASAYNIDPAALVSSFVSAKNAQAAATKANLVSAPITDNVYQPGAGGTLNKVQTGTATPDSTLKEYQYAVQNDGFTGSLADWNSQKANQKVSDSVTHDPLTGGLQVVQRAGPSVAGTSGVGAGIPSATPTPVKLPTTGATPTPADVNPTTKPPTAPVINPLDTLQGSDLAYAQTGLPAQAKFKYPGQIDDATKRIQAVIPGWTPATATASYAFFKSPATQTFIANSNTVLNSLNLMKSLSSKVSRGDFTFANGQLTGVKAGLSDQNAANFLQAAKIVGDEGGKLLGSAGGSDFTTALGLSLINTNYSDPTFQGTMDQLAGRVNNKVSEYYAQAGNAAGNQAPSSSTGSPQGNGNPLGI